MNAVARLAVPEPMRVITTDTAADPRNFSRLRSASGSTSTPRTRISTAPASCTAQRLPQPLLAEAELVEHLEAAHAFG